MSDLPVVAALDAPAARSLTDEVKADAAALWQKLLTLYEGGAHTALGYSSWGAYFEAEFGQGKSHGYRLLEAARAVRGLPDSPMGERPNERQARELARVPEPERPAVWQQATERAEAEERPVTAADVRAVVEPAPAPAHEEPAALSPRERVAREPDVIAQKAIRCCQDMVQIIEAAGGIDAVMNAVDSSPIGPTVRGTWTWFVVPAHDLLGEWRERLAQPGLRRVK